MGTPRRIVVRRSVAAAALVALLAAGCHAGGGSATPSARPVRTPAPMSTPSCSDRTTRRTARRTSTACPASRTSRRSRETPPSARTWLDDGFQVGHLALVLPGRSRERRRARAADEPQHDRAGDHGLFRDRPGRAVSFERTTRTRAPARSSRTSRAGPSQRTPGGVVLLDELEELRTEEPAFAEYLSIVVEVVERSGGRLFCGAELDAMPEPPGRNASGTRS